MIKLIKQLAKGKKEYNEQLARIEALPEDYRFVMKKIHSYMWSFAAGIGTDMLKIHDGVLDLFEAGAADGKHVLEITGEDVAGFCDELLLNVNIWDDGWREKLNRDINGKLGGK